MNNDLQSILARVAEWRGWVFDSECGWWVDTNAERDAEHTLDELLTGNGVFESLRLLQERGYGFYMADALDGRFEAGVDKDQNYTWAHGDTLPEAVARAIVSSLEGK